MSTSHFDIVIIGAGPAGLSFARSLAHSALRIAIVDPANMEQLRTPAPDGREIALTHPSKQLLQQLGAWQAIPEGQIFYLRSAKVVDGDSPFELHFKTPTASKNLSDDTLGYLVSNHHIRQALFEKTEPQANLTWFAEQKVQTVNADSSQATVCLSSGETIQAKLVVAADSRFSQTRQQMGIPVDMHDFGRTVITCRIEHSGTNENTAFECFHYGRTLAILPLTEHLSSAVITIDSQRTSEVLDLSDDALAADLEQRLNGRLGTIKVASSRYRYPLVGTHARRFYSTRFALIGDAAVGMHPVTAHGYNLGLYGQNTLSELIQKAETMGRDIGSGELLQQYDRRHQLKTRPIYHGTNFVVKLFTNEAPPAKLLRGAVLRVSNALSPVKSLISRQLTG
ncbi:5-demethoxyubiquinol-8 5-hydroxylase UbiM [Hydromonas duriensis]|uniref:Ubiquinone biosynthesis UbiH/UbiF/VisC/COQ6 family hydroxylase n=1 Tax=Hydromonas duriensis TaxID=1527608 RepID=A0A4V3DK39_9BURK|nr:5-demethoxyubiquinol-8 5-hydroxylase UbiM [Hydromonas duriensis]TDR32326.1 ubiquinone biosynthesis UbiH/UbiF/VisC/COQ6 family hydroxylase [Hydromonas duriensis]